MTGLLRALILLLAVVLGGLPAAAAERVVRVGLYDNPPKLLADARGQPGGIFGELLVEIARQEGWTLVPVTCDWESCLRQLQDGGIDLMPDVAKTEARAKQFDFHRVPALHSWSQLYRRAGDATPQSTLDLQDRRIASLAGSVQLQYLQGLLAGFGLKAEFLPVRSFEEGFAAVARGDADLVAANRHFGDAAASRHGLAATPVVFLPSQLHFAAGKGRQADLLAAIDTRLEAWQADPGSHYFRTLGRWGLSPETPRVPLVFWWALAAVVALLLLALGFVALLRREVARQTQALRAGEDKLATILNGVDAFIFIKDPLLRYQYVNRKVCDDMGQPAEAIIGRTDFELRDAATAALRQASDRELLATRQRTTQEVTSSPSRGGPQRTLLTVKLPLRAPDGSVQAICGIATDITELKQSQEQLRRLADELESRVVERTRELDSARRRAEAASRAKSEFLSRMSHELRTPLNAILGFAQLLQMSQPASKPREWSGEIARAGRHLLQMIDELLDLARIEAGRMTVRLERLDAGAVLDEAMALVQPLAAARGQRLLRAGGDGDLQPVRADRLRLRQVLVNLLGNAIKYGPADSRIELRCDRRDGRVRIAIADQGPGLTPEQLARLFQPFERLDAEQGEIEGTGIGLALSRQLAGLMQADLGADSTPGAGSVFWLDLPADDEPPPALAAGSAIITTPTSRLDVLYIEDNAVNVELVQAFLARSPGLLLRVAASGEAGLAAAHTQRPDLVLLDINLPGLDGYEVLKALRADPDLATVPVIALTADAMPHDIERGLAAGFDRYLVKPLDLPLLQAAIEALVVRQLPLVTP